MKKIKFLLVGVFVLALSGCFSNKTDKEEIGVAEGVNIVSSKTAVEIYSKSKCRVIEIEVSGNIEEKDILAEKEILEISKKTNGKTTILLAAKGREMAENEKLITITGNNLNVKVKTEMNDIQVKKATRATPTVVAGDEKLLGDFDNNGIVDLMDQVVFKQYYGTTNADYDIAPAVKGTGKWANINCAVAPDGQVNILDFVTFSNNYGMTVSIKWNILVYIAGDNDLEDSALADIEEMKNSYVSNPNINIIVMFDGLTNGDSYYGKVEKNSMTTLKNLGEVNSGDVNVLNNFIDFGVTNYPADKYALVLWNHGGGVDKSLSDDDNRVVCYDFNGSTKPLNIDSLSDNEVATALVAFKNKIGKDIDLVAMDACLMQMLEVGYEIKESAKYFIASEETEGADGFEYNEIIPVLQKNTAVPNRDFFKKIIEMSSTSSWRATRTLSLIDLKKVGNVVTNCNEFANELQTMNKTVVTNAIDNTKSFYISSFKDIIDFTNKIGTTKAINFANSLKECIVANSNRTANAYGISMYFGKVTSKYQNHLFCKDTTWDEFLKTIY